MVKIGTPVSSHVAHLHRIEVEHYHRVGVGSAQLPLTDPPLPRGQGRAGFDISGVQL